jgi:hypothetical protein
MISSWSDIKQAHYNLAKDTCFFLTGFAAGYADQCGKSNGEAAFNWVMYTVASRTLLPMSGLDSKIVNANSKFSTGVAMGTAAAVLTPHITSLFNPAENAGSTTTTSAPADDDYEPTDDIDQALGN